MLYLANLAVAVGGKLGSSLACRLGGFSYHFGFYLVETCKLIVDIRVGECYSFFKQVRLTVEQLAHFIHLFCGDGDGAADRIVVVEVGGAILVADCVVGVGGLTEISSRAIPLEVSHFMILSLLALT